MEADVISFPTAKGSRFQPIDRYAGGSVKTYYDTLSGETLTRGEYQRLRKDGYIPNKPNVRLTDEAESVADDVETDAPPVRAHRDQADGGDGAPLKVTPTSKAGVFETLAPGIGVCISALAEYFQEKAPILFCTPPPRMSQPVLVPLARIADRHSPIGVAIEATQDGKDLIEAASAFSVCALYMFERFQELRRAAQEEGYDETPSPQPTPRTRSAQRTARSDGFAAQRGRTDGTAPPTEVAGVWARLPEQWRHLAGGVSTGGNAVENGNGTAFADDRALRNVSIARQAEMVADLLKRDEYGRLSGGLF